MALQAIPGGWLMRLFFPHFCFKFLVAILANIRTGSQEKTFQFGFMGVMAPRALSLPNRRFMFTLPSVYSLLKVRMAREPEGALFFDDHPFDIAPVGIMT